MSFEHFSHSLRHASEKCGLFKRRGRDNDTSRCLRAAQHTANSDQNSMNAVVNSVIMHNTPPLTTAHVLDITILVIHHNFIHTFYYMVWVRTCIRIKITTKGKKIVKSPSTCDRNTDALKVYFNNGALVFDFFSS